MTRPEADRQPPGWGRRLEALVLIPNLLFIGVVVLYLLSVQAGTRLRVGPLAEGERKTEARIAELEQRVARGAGRADQPLNLIELANLYQQVGEFPWSYNALLDAERQGGEDPEWRLRLGLAYLALGKNRDAVRVLGHSRAACRERPADCDANTRVKLEIFDQVARLYHKRGIDARKDHGAAEKALHEVLKPVQVDPETMRPKAPASPPSMSVPVGPGRG